MQMTPRQKRSFELACNPLLKWLNENATPHSKVIVTPVDAELVSGENVYENENFVNDVRALK